MNDLLKKLEKDKILRDPMYGNIPVEYQIIWDLINTREFQRLRRIKQLSGVQIVFHTAEHSRFAHSIGTYHIANRFVKESVLKDYFKEQAKVLFLVAALIHDLGHGPYSHAFERAFDINHEKMTMRIINENTEIAGVLAKYEGLQAALTSIFMHKGNYPIIESLISSQLDVDRLDYLNRDANSTNANYGYVDVDRIIRILRIVDGKVCYLEKGINTIENYLMSRYHMYWQIYYHSKARAYELLLEFIYSYIGDHKDKIQGHNSFIKFINNQKDLDSYLMLDDYYVVGMILEYANSNDEFLSYLCNCFLNRHLFKDMKLKDKKALEFNKKIKEANKDNPYFKYLYKEEEVSQVAYLNNKRGNQVSEILILDEGKLLPLDKASKVVESLLESGKKTERKIFYDERKL